MIVFIALYDDGPSDYMGAYATKLEAIDRIVKYRGKSAQLRDIITKNTTHILIFDDDMYEDGTPHEYAPWIIKEETI